MLFISVLQQVMRRTHSHCCIVHNNMEKRSEGTRRQCKKEFEEFLEKLYLPLLAWPLIVLQHNHHVVLVVRFAT